MTRLSPAREPELETIHRALAEARIGHQTVKQLCVRYRIKPATLYRWRRRFEGDLAWSIREWVLAGLVYHEGHATTRQLMEYVDWRNHLRLSRNEVRKVIRALIAEELVEREEKGWRLCGDWP